MERAGAYDIPQSEIAAAGVGAVVEREIPIPVGATRWTLHVIPESVAAADDCPFTMEFYVGDGKFYEPNPAATATALINRDNIITREDLVTRIKAKITLPASLPDGDILLRLLIGRGGHS